MKAQVNKEARREERREKSGKWSTGQIAGEEQERTVVPGRT